ncbi:MULTISPECIES: hypothetical protein [Streptomyces]|uniref:Uncharacterized protein n=1 Tax=Streptomyces spinosisporus TaxID=2927582 RepID=A0ABS9XQ82_9ACTN|nr:MULTISPECIES: hypothetical protein [Streptomyces]MCI3244090.1 hypothetical protein [Streptomyces spinosisporus]WUB41060.1 hypothetical protein OHN38_41480 [Streptomyces sp. NBC_00588]
MTTLDSPAADPAAVADGLAPTPRRPHLVRFAFAGQWPMMLSGGMSVLVGAQFMVRASASGPRLTHVGGYAVLGGVSLLVSALRLGRLSQAA